MNKLEFISTWLMGPFEEVGGCLSFQSEMITMPMEGKKKNGRERDGFMDSRTLTGPQPINSTGRMANHKKETTFAGSTKDMILLHTVIFEIGSVSKSCCLLWHFLFPNCD